MFENIQTYIEHNAGSEARIMQNIFDDFLAYVVSNDSQMIRGEPVSCVTDALKSLEEAIKVEFANIDKLIEGGE